MLTISCQEKSSIIFETASKEDAKPWVFWYWMHGAVSREGITADLKAMKEAGIGGAYLFSIKDTNSAFTYKNHVRQLTPEWWQMVEFAFNEARRLNLQMAFHACDGFTTAGGPWITPELSMQKVVWADTIVSGRQLFNSLLPQPEKIRDYYEDIAVFALPAGEGWGESFRRSVPTVTSSLKGTGPQYLAVKGNSKYFSSEYPCRIQYSFKEPFTCRSVIITTGWHNYQSNRLKLEVSNDGDHFTSHGSLEPYRHGWQDLGITSTHLMEPVTARHFRFVYDPAGSEPGAEDLDNAKWSPGLSIAGIVLSGTAKIHQYEGKSGVIWRISKRTGEQQISETECVDPGKMVNITRYLENNGKLKWEVPEGNWMILRMGHTSTGHTNYTGGGGLGLECDKFNPEAVRIQFDNWFSQAYGHAGKNAESVLKVFHVDSWECGSQNWSPVFREEFRKRRGYDLLPYLPVMAGIPLHSAGFTEKVLYDVRLTISELVTDNFYKVLANLAHEKNCLFSAESMAPVFAGDGMLHFREVDIPMGEFWLRSPSHDKPNDILDAVSAGHIYGKNIIRAESFTEIRLDWDEHPGMMKTLADRNFAAGINSMAFHVFTHDPWTYRKPGMTLDKVGSFFQGNQTWWKPGKAWVEYITRCQELLQKGKPVVDLAVFTGEEIPSRAVLPDRLTGILPGIMGKERVAEEKIRLSNEGIPVRDMPAGVRTVANMADPERWTDPLKGYKYDSFNKDALLRLAIVENGRIILPGGMSYGLLVVPGTMKMNPDGHLMSTEVAEKLCSLANQGATILMMDKPEGTPGWQNDPSSDARLKEIAEELFKGERRRIEDGDGNAVLTWRKGSGQIMQGPYSLNDMSEIRIERDFYGLDRQNRMVDGLAWTHRVDGNKDIYFISNQKDESVELMLSFRVDRKIPELYHPVINETVSCKRWRMAGGRTLLDYRFQPGESLFVTFDRQTSLTNKNEGPNWTETQPLMEIDGDWAVQFDPASGGPLSTVIFSGLDDWSKNEDERIRYYSGTAFYSKNFIWKGQTDAGNSFWLETGKPLDMAEVRLNGHSCGICWTPPYRVKIDKYLKAGENNLEIAVTNTWHNRLIGDHNLPEDQRITWTTAPYRLEGKSLLPAGLLGPVKICSGM